MSDREFDIKKAYEKWLREEQKGGHGKKNIREEKENKGKKSIREEKGIPGKKSIREEKGSREKKHIREETDSRKNKNFREKKPVGSGENIVCPYAKRCGGCSYINRDYKWSLGYKEMKIRKLLKPYVDLSGIVGMETLSITATRSMRSLPMCGTVTGSEMSRAFTNREHTRSSRWKSV